MFLGIVNHAQAQCTTTVFTGEGTFYEYNGGGNCSYPNPYTNLPSGALNQSQYGSAQLCGACAEVTGERGSLVISIEDQCPECQFGDVDLEKDAFPLIADPIKGRVPIRWKLVPCPVSGPVVLYFKEGSHQWWKAIQVRNHRYPIAKLECKINGQYVALPRQAYNYFVSDQGLGSAAGPFDFRITDTKGEVIEETNIPFIVTTPIVGRNQFSACPSNEPIQTPYAGIIPIPGVVEAENYDNGGEGISFHDTTPSNLIGPFRNNLAVDTEPCSEGGNNLAFSDNGEWTEYTVNVTTSGSYQLDTRVASLAGGSFHLEFDGANVTGTVPVPNTGGWQSWQTVSKTVTLSAGQHVMRFVIDQKEFNINKFAFASTGGIVSGQVYRLVARHSGQVLDVNQCSLTNGMKVQQWPWQGGNCQRWKITATDNGFYKLTAQHSGQALEVGSALATNGAKVNQWPSNDCTCQQWKIESTEAGFYKLTARHSDQVLEVGSALTSDGAAVNQWPWNTSFCQQWAIEPVAAFARLGIQEHLASAQFNLSLTPNPANDQVQLDWKEVREEDAVLTVVNAQGKLVHQQVVRGTSHQLPTAKFSDGLYIISLRSSQAVATKKLMIHH